jgi:hypothetical protein
MVASQRSTCLSRRILPIHQSGGRRVPPTLSTIAEVEEPSLSGPTRTVSPTEANEESAVCASLQDKHPASNSGGKDEEDTTNEDEKSKHPFWTTVPVKTKGARLWKTNKNIAMTSNHRKLEMVSPRRQKHHEINKFPVTTMRTTLLTTTDKA